MAKNDFTESVPDSPQEIVVSIDEWTEIEGSLIALHAAMEAGCASNGYVSYCTS